MVSKKIQVPAVGGIRKVIQPSSASTATTIAGLEGQTLSVGQLKALLGNVPASGPSAPGAAAAAASLVPGPGLTGGGPMVGAVPIRLLYPTPPIVWNEALLPDDWIGSGGSGGSAGGGSLATLSDVALTSQTTGQVLTWNGTKWTNETVSGGGGTEVLVLGGNIGPDVHPGTPTPWDDEFEHGTSLDTTGARFPGANAWTVENALTSSNVVSTGSLLLTIAGGSANDDTVLLQSLTSVGATWEFTCKKLSADTNLFAGMFVGFAATGKGYYFGCLSTTLYLISQNTYAGSGVSAVTNTSFGASAGNLLFTDIYLKIKYDGTDLTFWAAYDGLNFYRLFSVLPSTFLGGNPDSIGLMGGSPSVSSPLSFSVSFDWFRRTDNAAAPTTAAILDNITPDTHPNGSTAWDDEFEFGTAIDTTGARRSGANAWTGVTSAGTLSSVVAQGALQNVVLTGASPSAGAGYSQPVPSGTWTFVWKGVRPAIVLYNSSTWKDYYFGTSGSGNNFLIQAETRDWATGAYTFGSSISSFSSNGSPAYFQLKFDGTNFIFSWCQSGYNSDFTQLTSQAASGWIVTPTHIGIGNTAVVAMDWFRRTA